MLTKNQWGPKLWDFLHACSFAFPDNPTPEQTQAFEKLLEALRVLLPCPNCRQHYNEFIEENPAPATCGVQLQKWLVDFHNDVNERLGKPRMSLDSVKENYDPLMQFSDTGGTSSLTIIVVVVIVVILIATLLIIYWRRHSQASKISFLRSV